MTCVSTRMRVPVPRTIQVVMLLVRVSVASLCPICRVKLCLVFNENGAYLRLAMSMSVVMRMRVRVRVRVPGPLYDRRSDAAARIPARLIAYMMMMPNCEQAKQVHPKSQRAHNQELPEVAHLWRLDAGNTGSTFGSSGVVANASDLLTSVGPPRR